MFSKNICKEKRITFKIERGYYVELFTHETIKLFGSTESKITKDENGEKVSHLEFIYVVLVHYNTVNRDYQHNLRVLYIFIPKKSFGHL